MLANIFLIVASVAVFVVAAPVTVPSRGALVTSTQVTRSDANIVLNLETRDDVSTGSQPGFVEGGALEITARDDVSTDSQPGFVEGGALEITARDDVSTGSQPGFVEGGALEVTADIF